MMVSIPNFNCVSLSTSTNQISNNNNNNYNLSNNYFQSSYVSSNNNSHLIPVNTTNNYSFNPPLDLTISNTKHQNQYYHNNENVNNNWNQPRTYFKSDSNLIVQQQVINKPFNYNFEFNPSNEQITCTNKQVGTDWNYASYGTNIDKKIISSNCSKLIF